MRNISCVHFSYRDAKETHAGIIPVVTVHRTSLLMRRSVLKTNIYISALENDDYMTDPLPYTHDLKPLRERSREQVIAPAINISQAAHKTSHMVTTH
jgi:hypothetical protein